ncbi:MAG: glycosyl hydrolase family 28 protein [Aquirufa sp.]
MKSILFSGFFVFLLQLSAIAKDFDASIFGIKSDGITLNTQSIQKAIDLIQEKGGGKLIFSVGKYLTGSIQLKSNVSIELKEGAVLIGTSSFYDYVALNGNKALIVADGEKNVGIFGKGFIQGQGAAVSEQLKIQIQKGHIKENFVEASPALISFSNCTEVKLEGIHLQNACGKAVNFNHCTQIKVQEIYIKNTWEKDLKGLVGLSCEDLQLKNCYFETTGSALDLDEKSSNISKENVKNAAGKLL